jgi:hypothetical protein
MFMLGGCLSMNSYVDPALPAANKASVKPVSHPAPIQVLVEFRTKGVPNAGGTQRLTPVILDVAKESGLFSEVDVGPAANGRRLVITVDNVPITSESDAMTKGFGTGLTFGLVGTMVTDGYVCEAIYTAPSGAPVKFSYRHALHTTIGNASGPPGLVGKKPAEATRDIAAQLAWSILRDLSRNEGFAQ